MAKCDNRGRALKKTPFPEWRTFRMIPLLCLVTKSVSFDKDIHYFFGFTLVGWMVWYYIPVTSVVLAVHKENWGIFFDLFAQFWNLYFYFFLQIRMLKFLLCDLHSCIKCSILITTKWFLWYQYSNKLLVGMFLWVLSWVLMDFISFKFTVLQK